MIRDEQSCHWAMQRLSFFVERIQREYFPQLSNLDVLVFLSGNLKLLRCSHDAYEIICLDLLHSKDYLNVFLKGFIAPCTVVVILFHFGKKFCDVESAIQHQCVQMLKFDSYDSSTLCGL